MIFGFFYSILYNINYNKKKLKLYNKKRYIKPPFKTFQHRAKLSLSLKKFKISDVYKNKITNTTKKVMSLLIKKKISLANKGKKRTNDVKKKISLALSGRKISFEHKMKIKKKLSGKNNPRFGKKHSKISKRKISVSLSKKKRI